MKKILSCVIKIYFTAPYCPCTLLDSFLFFIITLNHLKWILILLFFYLCELFLYINFFLILQFFLCNFTYFFLSITIFSFDLFAQTILCSQSPLNSFLSLPFLLKILASSFYLLLCLVLGSFACDVNIVLNLIRFLLLCFKI